VYDLFIEWVARPIYRFVVKPTMSIRKATIIALKYIGKFIGYLIFATTGNAIVILTLISCHSKILLYISELDKSGTIVFYLLAAVILLVIFICLMFIYNVFLLIFNCDRDDIIEKEPEFIQEFLRKTDHFFFNLKTDVKRSDEVIQTIKEKRREERASRKALKSEAKRFKEAERKRRLDIIHDRTEIIDL
jgi:hypothetical protein